MPYYFEFDPAHRILLVVLEGDVGDREMLKIDDDIKAHVTDLNASAGIRRFFDSDDVQGGPSHNTHGGIAALPLR
jgi:hypothetical protein